MIRLTPRAVAAALVAVATVSSLTISTALAHAIRAGGTPSDLNSGQSGYYVWNDGHEVHLRVAAGGTADEYRGTLRTAGKFVNLTHEGDDHDEHSGISGSGHILHFRMSPGGALDGFKVRVEDSTTVDLRLKRDGDAAPADRIWLGSDDRHPDSSEFSLRI